MWGVHDGLLDASSANPRPIAVRALGAVETAEAENAAFVLLERRRADRAGAAATQSASF